MPLVHATPEACWEAFWRAVGNGPFGFGWSLSLASITRKTGKGLPRYHDADASVLFFLSDAGSRDLLSMQKLRDRCS
jgi:hypothetical protein